MKILRLAALCLFFFSCSKLSNPNETGAVDCNLCHNTAALSGLHTFHLQITDCQACHPGSHALDTQVVNDTLHRNGRVDVAFDTVAGNRAAFDSTNKTCSQIACHGRLGGGGTQPVSWLKDTALACGACHALPPATGAHRVHADSGDTAACHTCHPPAGSATHNNGTVDLQFHGRAGDSAAFNAASKTCTSIYCHGAFPGGRKATRIWNAPVPFACGDCHALPPSTGAHQKHTDTATYHLACDSCHPAAPASRPFTHGQHINGTTNVSIQGTYASRTCNAVACHVGGRLAASDTARVLSQGVMHWKSSGFKWDSTLTCTGCHDTRDHATMCEYCHDDVVGPSSHTSIADPKIHIPEIFQ